ncbi:hypothetical protein AXI85_gp01 [Ralstonia phage RS138]|nr:hypothetical protein AXI85_gp01 [Ralstonia phage RS138]BAS32799.1 hypothetical protein [Ralstonia phage RS138]
MPRSAQSALNRAQFLPILCQSARTPFFGAKPYPAWVFRLFGPLLLCAK